MQARAPDQRQLPSGRWQARYKGPDGIDRPAPRTFATKRDAEIWLTKTEVEILNDEWLDPDAGAIAFKDYAESWIQERPNLRPKTIELYRYLLGRHLLPALGNRPLRDIRDPTVRRWRKERLDADVSAVTVAKAYRLLKAIMSTAVDDGLIRRNPCRIKGAGQERSAERPVLTVAQVFTLADTIDQRYRALVLLASFTSIRWGELAALRRCDIDLHARSVRIGRTLIETQNGDLSYGPPKSDAGKRVVMFPKLIVSALGNHLGSHAQPGDDGLVFTAPGGQPLRRGNFRRRVWLPALQAAGLPSVHFHDLRHTGNNLTAHAGANLRELMTRMGHTSTRAALIYLHATDERQRAITDSLDTLARAELKQIRQARRRTSGKASGTQRARKQPGESR
jgi:integrase